MIRVDEEEPVGEIPLSFPYRDVRIRKGDPKELYELQSEIGRGKFGTVYKCKEKKTGLELAAKFISTPKKEDRRNVEREVEIMKSLQHPRLLQIYDAFENGKNMYMILELIEGGELFERVIDDDFVLTEKSCTVFMRQICEGVGFIHQQNILHLDMKPENILCLTKTGNRIKIIDFGLARKYDATKNLQVLFGTPEFVAPEVVNFDKIGFGTDMWSVGVICYVLLSGLSPFMGGTDIETMANVTIGKYDFDDEAFQDISKNAKDFISKLLLKDMDKRMTAEECLEHIWLQRRAPPEPQHVDSISKENLKQFVERWNEHPNSPYIFEITSHLITPSLGRLQLSESMHSLEALSPSPCGSLDSSSDSEDGFPQRFINNLMIPQDHFRRASDTCIIRRQDGSDRVNLADEIRKLTDKLFQLANPSNGSKPIEIPSAKQNKRVFTEDNFKRQTFRLTNNSRDVPIEKARRNQLDRDFMLGGGKLRKQDSNESAEIAVNRTKAMLLNLLDQWDGPQVPSRPNPRHGSVSTEWSENDLLGQRTISSLNMFFQSRSTNKQIHPLFK